MPIAAAFLSRSVIPALALAALLGAGCSTADDFAGAESGASKTLAVGSDSEACQALPFEERRAVLVALNEEQRVCADDNDCPCGSYCSSDATCQVECMAEEPGHPTLNCPGGQSCTPLGRCADTPSDPGPAVELTLEITPARLIGNTAAEEVVVQAEVTVVASSLDVLEPEHPARVFIGLAERGDPDPGVLPEVRCAAPAEFAPDCELDGGWTFDIQSGSLRSHPRPVWVRIPQLATQDDWTLEARSEWADLPASAVVSAEPIVHSETGVGAYTGTITWPQVGGNDLTLDVTAWVTDSHVALFESTRMLLPEGQVVLARDQGFATMLEWLRSDQPGSFREHLRIRLDPGALTYTAADGRLTATIEMRSFQRTVPLALDLHQTGDISSPVCTSSSACGQGTYCETQIGRCLPGSAPPFGGIVADAQAGSGDSILESAQVQSWEHPLTTMRSANWALLGGEDVIGMEHAYCYRSGQLIPGLFAHRTGEPSLDLNCDNQTAAGTPQRAFSYANRITEVEVNADQEETFNLLEECLTDLSVQPTSPYTPANLLPDKKCVSLGRFLTAVKGGPAATRETAGRLLFGQILRQWVGVHAFVARASVQEQEFQDVLGTGGQPAQDRLGHAVDLVERGWRVLLSLGVRRGFMEAGAQTTLALHQPEYRLINRPQAHWGFNGTGSARGNDSERDFDLSMSGNLGTGQAVVVLPDTNGLCRTPSAISLPSASFSIAGYIGSNVPTRYTVFTTEPAGFWIELEPSSSPDTITVRARDIFGGMALFHVPAVAGYYALVVDGSDTRLYRVTSNAVEEFTNFGGEVSWPQSAARVKLACDVPTGGGLTFDEVTVWGRPLQPQAVLTMGKRFFNTLGEPQFGTDTLPPLAPGDIDMGPGDEQAVSLAAHLIEAGSAHAQLLAAYIEAERGSMYEECYLGGTSAAQDRVLGRVGRGLRLISLLEGDAAWIARDGGGLPWYARYQAGLVELAGKRRKVIDALELVESCTNPLGISEDDLPLFVGNVDDAAEEFFASSRYLAGLAQTELDKATAEQGQARDAYWQQRLSEYQVEMSGLEKDERIRKLKLDYEGRLRGWCGRRPGGQELLPAFLDGTLTISSCFIRTEQSGCQNVGDGAIVDAPPECLKGELGARVLAIQAAAINADNASRAYDRAYDQFNAEGEYCARRQAHLEEDQSILTLHHEHMKKLRKKKRKAGFFGGLVSSIGKFAIGAVTENVPLVLEGFFGVGDTIIEDIKQGIASSEAEELDMYQQVVQARSAELDIMSCYHGADTYKFAIDAAHDVTKSTLQDIQEAGAGLMAAHDELAALVDEARGQIAVEQGLDRTPPSHHFWLDDHIEKYRRHLRYGRRLTYLAVRSLEYESQQSLGWRGLVLSARDPEPLLQVVTGIQQRNAPMQGEQGFVIGDASIILSLRDDILQLEDLVGNAAREPGDPPLSAEEAFGRFLRSPSARIYDRNGAYVGQGIRFVMDPAEWSQTTCAERTWKVATSVQMSNPIANPILLLLQENAFASQTCHEEERGDLTVARIRPNHNLLLDDETPASFEEPSQYTGMNVEGFPNRSEDQMRNLVDGLQGGFAGRGVYGNYILVFPSAAFTDPVLANVKDVLIRFDMVHVTNADFLQATDDDM